MFVGNLNVSGKVVREDVRKNIPAQNSVPTDEILAGIDKLPILDKDVQSANIP